MKFRPRYWLQFAFGLALLVLPLAGCEDRTEPGPAERAGKKIDQAVDKMQNEAEKAGKKIKDKIEDLKE